MFVTFRQKLKEGVVRDVERQRVAQEMNKTINTYNLQQQKDLTKILRREENELHANETWDCSKKLLIKINYLVSWGKDS